MNPYLRIALLSAGLWVVLALLASAVTGHLPANPLATWLGHGLAMGDALRTALH